MAERPRSTTFYIVTGEGVRDNNWHCVPKGSPNTSFNFFSYTTLSSKGAPVSSVHNNIRVFPSHTEVTFPESSTTTPTTAVPPSPPRSQRRSAIESSAGLATPTAPPHNPSPQNPITHPALLAAAPNTVPAPSPLAVNALHARQSSPIPPAPHTGVAPHPAGTNPLQPTLSSPSTDVGLVPLHPAAVQQELSVSTPIGAQTATESPITRAAAPNLHQTSGAQRSGPKDAKLEPTTLPTIGSAAPVPSPPAEPAPDTTSVNPHPRPRQLRTARMLIATPNAVNTSLSKTSKSVVTPTSRISNPVSASQSLAPSGVLLLPPDAALESPTAQSPSDNVTPTVSANPSVPNGCSISTDERETLISSAHQSKSSSQQETHDSPASGSPRVHPGNVLPQVSAVDTPSEATESNESSMLQRVRQRMQQDRRPSPSLTKDSRPSSQFEAMQNIVERHKTSDRRRTKSLPPLPVLSPKPMGRSSPKVSEHENHNVGTTQSVSVTPSPTVATLTPAVATFTGGNAFPSSSSTPPLSSAASVPSSNTHSKPAAVSSTANLTAPASSPAPTTPPTAIVLPPVGTPPNASTTANATLPARDSVSSSKASSGTAAALSVLLPSISSTNSSSAVDPSQKPKRKESSTSLQQAAEMATPATQKCTAPITGKPTSANQVVNDSNSDQPKAPQPPDTQPAAASKIQTFGQTADKNKATTKSHTHESGQAELVRRLQLKNQNQLAHGSPSAKTLKKTSPPQTAVVPNKQSTSQLILKEVPAQKPVNVQSANPPALKLPIASKKTEKPPTTGHTNPSNIQVQQSVERRNSAVESASSAVAQATQVKTEVRNVPPPVADVPAVPDHIGDDPPVETPAAQIASPVVNGSSSPVVPLPKKRKMSDKDEPVMDVLRHLVQTVVHYNQKHSVRGRQFVEDRRSFLRDVIAKMADRGHNGRRVASSQNRRSSEVIPSKRIPGTGILPATDRPKKKLQNAGSRAQQARDVHHPQQSTAGEAQQARLVPKKEIAVSQDTREATQTIDQADGENLRVLRKICLKFKEWKREFEFDRKPTGDITDTMSRLNTILSKENQVQLWDEIGDDEILGWLEQLGDAHRTINGLWVEVSNNLLALRGTTPEKSRIRADSSKRLETLVHITKWCHTVASWTINRCEMHQDGNFNTLRKFHASITKFLEADGGRGLRQEITLLGRFRTISKNITQFCTGRQSANAQLVASGAELKNAIGLLIETAARLSDAARELQERLKRPRKDTRPSETDRQRGRTSPREGGSGQPSSSVGISARRRIVRNDESDGGRPYSNRGEDVDHGSLYSRGEEDANNRPCSSKRRESATQELRESVKGQTLASSRRLDTGNSQDGIELPSRPAPLKRKLSDGAYKNDGSARDERATKKRAIDLHTSQAENVNASNRASTVTSERQKPWQSTSRFSSKDSQRATRDHTGNRNVDRASVATSNAPERPVQATQQSRHPVAEGSEHVAASRNEPVVPLDRISIPRRSEHESHNDVAIAHKGPSFPRQETTETRTVPYKEAPVSRKDKPAVQNSAGTPSRDVANTRKEVAFARSEVAPANVSTSRKGASDAKESAIPRKGIQVQAKGLRASDTGSSHPPQSAATHARPNSQNRLGPEGSSADALNFYMNERNADERQGLKTGFVAQQSGNSDSSNGVASVRSRARDATGRAGPVSILKKKEVSASSTVLNISSQSRSRRKITFHPDVVTRTSLRPSDNYDALSTLHLDGYDLLADKISLQASAVNERVAHLNRQSFGLIFAHLVRYVENLKREAERAPPIESDRMRLPYPPSALLQWARHFDMKLPPRSSQSPAGRGIVGALGLRSARPPMPTSQQAHAPTTVQNGVPQRALLTHPQQYTQQPIQVQNTQQQHPQQQQQQHPQQQQQQHLHQSPYPYPQHHIPQQHQYHQHQHQHQLQLQQPPQQQPQEQQHFNRNQAPQHGPGYSGGDASRNNHGMPNGGQNGYKPRGPQ